ncbi:MAG: DUF309 domain-containing protein [Halodesulfurarchaeum sp.]
MDEHTRDPSVDPPHGDRNPTGWLPEERRWEHDTLRRAVVHGVRLFNAESYHASHDCFEDEWFNYGNGTREKDFLQGMVQVAAGAYKLVEHDEPEGLRRLLTTARGYLDDIPDDFYGVDVGEIRGDIEAVLEDRGSVEGWSIRLDGRIQTADEDDVAFAESRP